jgi:hypothetical protein
MRKERDDRVRHDMRVSDVVCSTSRDDNREQTSRKKRREKIVDVIWVVVASSTFKRWSEMIVALVMYDSRVSNQIRSNVKATVFIFSDHIWLIVRMMCWVCEMQKQRRRWCRRLTMLLADDDANDAKANDGRSRKGKGHVSALAPIESSDSWCDASSHH